MKTMPSSSGWLAPQSISFFGTAYSDGSVEIGSRCQSADTVSSKTNLKRPFQLEDDVHFISCRTRKEANKWIGHNME